jgi:asparagine synthase (glutamine-hydrolysing)
MSFLFGWIGSRGDPRAREVVGQMSRVLRTSDAEASAAWIFEGGAIGLMASPTEKEICQGQPTVSSDGRYSLWVAGEMFSSASLRVAVHDPASVTRVEFRRALLQACLNDFDATVAALDGEYHIAIWDARDRVLTLANDRFGGLPLYYASTSQETPGWSFAGGVRGVLMAPGVSADPDADALAEAVTFGGFRLGDRTQIASIKMLSGGTIVSVSDRRPRFRRYWDWSRIPDTPFADRRAVIEEMWRLWQKAVASRLAGAQRPGQTLSGGLDSRAILAEAAPRVPIWTAITYGEPDCDDARYARQAVDAIGAEWYFHRLYQPDWLDTRTSFVQATDGLIDLVDLMHLEALPLQVEHLDVHLSGFIGDAVSGPTFHDVKTAEDVLRVLPYYGTPLGLPPGPALDVARRLVAGLGTAPARFALFDHKIPQSTNRWTSAWRPWISVRKPFVDYDFFDFCQGLPVEARGNGRIYEEFLIRAYPDCFARIPNQKTGVPAYSPAWRAVLAKVRRRAWKVAQPPLRSLGLPDHPHIRTYHLDDEHWRSQAARHRIVSTILRPDSFCCAALGRSNVEEALNAWFDRREGPIQPIGAMYVAEVYHRDLPHTLREARASHPVRELTVVRV